MKSDMDSAKVKVRARFAQRPANSPERLRVVVARDFRVARPRSGRVQNWSSRSPLVVICVRLSGAKRRGLTIHPASDAGYCAN